MMRAGWRSVGSVERGAVFRGALDDLQLIHLWSGNSNDPVGILYFHPV